IRADVIALGVENSSRVVHVGRAHTTKPPDTRVPEPADCTVPEMAQTQSPPISSSVKNELDSSSTPFAVVRAGVPGVPKQKKIVNAALFSIVTSAPCPVAVERSASFVGVTVPTKNSEGPMTTFNGDALTREGML